MASPQEVGSQNADWPKVNFTCQDAQARSVYGLQPKMAISQLKTGAMPQPMVRMAFGQKTITQKSTASQSE
ncbi:hypothetical protein CGZ80_16230 [Rhodopirellula sp. MGV]|nr:hypothetical protein CGZ80_16230 [Rhodopirellula sp. MGV]PNY33630.1 hypothetical protein C2E31_27950 [Rhodopirellula baltica]